MQINECYSLIFLARPLLTKTIRQVEPVTNTISSSPQKASEESLSSLLDNTHTLHRIADNRRVQIEWDRLPLYMNGASWNNIILTDDFRRTSAP